MHARLRPTSLKALLVMGLAATSIFPNAAMASSVSEARPAVTNCAKDARPRASEVILWEGAGYTGRCARRSLGSYSSGQLGVSGGRISSLKTGGDVVARAFAGTFAGANVVYTGVHPQLGRWNDRIKSIRIDLRNGCSTTYPLIATDTLATRDATVNSPMRSWCFVATANEWYSVRGVGYLSSWGGDDSAQLSLKVRGPNNIVVATAVETADYSPLLWLTFKPTRTGRYRIDVRVTNEIYGQLRVRVDHAHEAAATDYSRDCVVDVTDYDGLVAVWKYASGGGQYDQAYDLEMNGVLDEIDYNGWLRTVYQRPGTVC